MKKNTTYWIIAILAVAVLYLWSNKTTAPADTTPSSDIVVTDKYQSDSMESEIMPVTSAPDEIEMEEETAMTADVLTMPSETTDMSGIFTHKAYGFTIHFPHTWHWDGSNVSSLVLSSKAITGSDEVLNQYNMKIMRADIEVSDADVESVSLGSATDVALKAVYLKDHNDLATVQQIITSFSL